MSKTIAFRAAIGDDIVGIVDLFARSRAAAMPFLPVLHSREEDLQFFSTYLEQGTMTLALDEAVVGFMVETAGWIEHLYLDPNRFGAGIGTALLAEAKGRQKTLRLWCFQQNLRACRFYEREGFEKVGATTGENEEKLPDILYEWRQDDPS